MDIELVTDGLMFPEGPIAMNDGSVILTEIEGQRLTRVTPDGKKEVFAETGGGPNGAAVGPDNAIYVTNNGGSFEWIKQDGLTIPRPPPPSPLPPEPHRRHDPARRPFHPQGHHDLRQLRGPPVRRPQRPRLRQA